MKSLFKRLQVFFLVSTTILLISVSSIFGNVDSTGANLVNKGKVAYVQEQYTPRAPEPATSIKQTQSVRVNPEIVLLSHEDVAYVDSIITRITAKIDAYVSNENKRIKEKQTREAIAYLYVLLAAWILSSIGIWIGNLSESQIFTWLGGAIFVATTIIFLLKIPIILLLF